MPPYSTTTRSRPGQKLAPSPPMEMCIRDSHNDITKQTAMLQGIKNIVFDLGGVMIDLDRARCVEEFHKIGFTEIDDLIDSYHPKGFLGRLERGDVTNDDFYDYVRRSLSLIHILTILFL